MNASKFAGYAFKLIVAVWIFLVSALPGLVPLGVYQLIVKGGF